MQMNVDGGGGVLNCDATYVEETRGCKVHNMVMCETHNGTCSELLTAALVRSYAHNGIDGWHFTTSSETQPAATHI
jgi:hypothetical protein